MIEPPQPNKFFIFITIAIVLLYAMNVMADPYENCDVKKVVVYDGKDIVSAETSFNCYTKSGVDNGGADIVQSEQIEELPQVVSLSEYINEWMN
tara:strand:- start:1772 stop:2053 length:282 start_codon:yes stop_codon:yes gene_type:complete